MKSLASSEANGCQEYINQKCIGQNNCVNEGGTLSNGKQCCKGLNRCSYKGNSQVYCRAKC